MSIHTLGYIALAVSLFSMTRKNVLTLRILSAAANAFYVVYGFLLNAPPLIIGCSTAILIHAYQIYKLRKSDE